MKPFEHAKISAKKFGGLPTDYMKIHDWFDQTKAHVPDVRHRAVLHNSFGIFLLEQFFGSTLTNSDGDVISVRDIGEQHVLNDLGYIPTLATVLEGVNPEILTKDKEPAKEVVIPEPLKIEPHKPELDPEQQKKWDELVEDLKKNRPPFQPQVRPLTPGTREFPFSPYDPRTWIYD